ncbi:hypothetical protein HMPREF9946_02213 [Acetobacteraceae bacterium AT-5844]|nr:hypothetical protein HMPREF9946_02213 [Acetobacteraceae bacterium AT-5844]
MPYNPVPRSVLALDIASRTGWAWGVPGGRLSHGIIDLPPPGIDLGAHGAAFADGLADLLSVHQPARIVVEAPFYASAGSPITIEALLGLNMMAHTIAWRWDVPIEKIASQTVRASLIGKIAKGESKAAVMAWARAQGHTPNDHNAADALALLTYALGLRKAAA